MNNLSEITDIILLKAKNEVEEKISLGKNEIEASTKKAVDEINNQEKIRLDKIFLAAEKELKFKLNRINLEAKQKVQSAKREYLSKAFSEAEEELNKMSKEEFLKFLKDTICQKVFQGEYKVFLGEKSSYNILQNDIDNLGQENKQSKFILSEEKIKNEGGFLLSKNKIEFNFLFSELINRLKEEIGPKVIDILFPEGGKINE